jgi:hypothetical protein
MFGSHLVAGWIAQWGFWILIGVGWLRGELALRGVAIFAALWLAGLIGLRHIPDGEFLFSPYAAALDIALVFAIFKGDIRLT